MAMIRQCSCRTGFCTDHCQLSEGVSLSEVCCFHALLKDWTLLQLCNAFYASKSVCTLLERKFYLFCAF